MTTVDLGDDTITTWNAQPEPPLPAAVERGDPRQAGSAQAGRRRVPPWLRRLSGPALLILAWMAVTSTGLVGDRTLTPPGDVVRAAQELWRLGDFQTHSLSSLQRVGIGLGLGVTIGLVLAVAAGLFRAGEDVIDSAMNVLRPIPSIALVPLIIIWFGIGETAKISLIVIATAFPIYMNTFAAIRGVDSKLVESAQAFGLRRAGLIRKVIIPGAVPGFLVGLRWAMGSAWLVLIFAEQINASSGIGYLMYTAREWGRTDIVVLGIVLYGILGFLADLVVRFLERVLLAWRVGFTGT